MLYQYWIASSLAFLAMTARGDCFVTKVATFVPRNDGAGDGDGAGDCPALTAAPSIPSLRAKAPWPSRGNPSSRRKSEDAISVLDCFVTCVPRNDGAGDGDGWGSGGAKGYFLFPSLRAKTPWPSRGNPSSRRGEEDAISVWIASSLALLAMTEGGTG